MDPSRRVRPRESPRSQPTEDRARERASAALTLLGKQGRFPTRPRVATVPGLLEPGVLTRDEEAEGRVLWVGQ